MPRFTLDLNDEITDRLEDYMAREHITRAEAIRRCILVLTELDRERQNGTQIGFLKESKESPTGYIGLGKIMLLF